MHISRLIRILVYPAALLMISLAHPALGQGKSADSPTGIRLMGEARGEAAIAALGNRLAEVAAFYGKSPEQLTAHLRHDPSLWVSPSGALSYACEGKCRHGGHEESPAYDELPAENIGPTDPPPFDPGQAFLLHSRPGANRVIYLDFDGHADTSGKWKAGAESPPFDLDEDPTTFSTTERERIISVWQRVAEDFAMYEIDVTTEFPGIPALTKTNADDSTYGIRVVIGGSSKTWFGNPVGGVASLGSFDDKTDTPCWVFPDQPGTGRSAFDIAETSSHEVGHTLGLAHDGVIGGTGYYAGQGEWRPIMGGGGDQRLITQWSKGEYAQANNTQDDLAVMRSQGAVYRDDDHGNNRATATVLIADSFSVSAAGVIEKSTDLDYFQIAALGGSLNITVNPAPNGANLRIEVKLYDTSGALLQSATAADTNDGTQPVTIIRTVDSGRYFISVDGIGEGNPATTGYSDYASLGQYQASISGVSPDGSGWLATGAGIKSWNEPLNWNPATVPNTAGAVAKINNNIAGDQTILIPGSTTIGTLILGDSDGTHAFTLASTDGPLIFNNAGSPAKISKSTGADDIISALLEIRDPLVITKSASGSLAFNGGIGGAGSLTKNGAGTVVIGAANTYTGATILADGLLRLDNENGIPGGIDNAAGSGESALVFDGGVLGLSTGNFTRQLGTGAGQLQWTNGSGGFAAFGANREVMLNNGTGTLRWDTDILGEGNTLILGHPAASHTLDFRNGVHFSGTQRTISVEDGEAAVDAVLSGVLAGNTSSGFIKSGNGVLALTRANIYGGTTTVADGLLLLQHASALPGGNLEIAGGTLGLGAGDLNLTRTLGTGLDQVRWSGGGGFAAFGATRVVKFSESVMIWTADNSIGVGHDLVLGHPIADGTLDWQQLTSLGGGSRTVRVEDGSAIIDAEMSGLVSGGSSGISNVFIKTGEGTLAFTATNNHWGDTIISGGTLMIGDGGETGGVSRNSPAILLETDAILAINRSNLLAQGNNAFKAPVTGEGNFAQVGSGTTVLTLANTYSGTTTISNGTLSLGADQVIANSSALTIGNATLDAGTGSNSIGTLNITGNATLQLGTGALLAFADSRGFDWNGGALQLTGSFVSGSSLRFGTSAESLTATQLASISLAGYAPFSLNADGYLTAFTLTSYAAWKSANAPNTGDEPGADEDDDGVGNGIEYLLGGSPSNNDLDKLPKISADGTNLEFRFIRDNKSIDAGTTVEVQTGSNLLDWPTSHPVPTTETANSIGVTVRKNVPSPGFDTVTLTLPLVGNTPTFVRIKIAVTE